MCVTQTKGDCGGTSGRSTGAGDSASRAAAAQRKGEEEQVEAGEGGGGERERRRGEKVGRPLIFQKKGSRGRRVIIKAVVMTQLPRYYKDDVRYLDKRLVAIMQRCIRQDPPGPQCACKLTALFS